MPVKYSEMLHIRVTKEQLQALTIRAAADKRSLSDWLRVKLDEIAREPLSGGELQPVGVPVSGPGSVVGESSMTQKVGTESVSPPPVSPSPAPDDDDDDDSWIDRLSFDDSK